MSDAAAEDEEQVVPAEDRPEPREDRGLGDPAGAPAAQPRESGSATTA